MKVIREFVRRHPVIVYFVCAYMFSLVSYLVVVGPELLRGGVMRQIDALIIFPVIIVGVCLTGSVLTGVVDGKSGLRDLLARIGRWRVGVQWYAAAVLIPPVFITIVLFVLHALVSPVFTPKFLLPGIVFGLVAGFFEEVGWMGYAFPKLRLKYDALPAALLLGGLWGLWHLPVIDFLGSASPHGMYWLPFVLAFIAVLWAVRVLIVWIYTNTRSILLAQLMHASSTGFLVVLSPLHMSPGQEVLWYAIYAAALWIVVGVVAVTYGKRLAREVMTGETAQAAVK